MLSQVSVKETKIYSFNHRAEGQQTGGNQPNKSKAKGSWAIVTRAELSLVCCNWLWGLKDEEIPGGKILVLRSDENECRLVATVYCIFPKYLRDHATCA